MPPKIFLTNFDLIIPVYFVTESCECNRSVEQILPGVYIEVPVDDKPEKNKKKSENFAAGLQIVLNLTHVDLNDGSPDQTEDQTAQSDDDRLASLNKFYPVVHNEGDSEGSE